MTESDELREAVRFLRRRADGVTPGPWTYNPYKQWHGPIGPTNSQAEEGVSAPGENGRICVAATGPADDPQSMTDAWWIATMTPELAEPLAALLETAAESVQDSHGDDVITHQDARALDIARIINGGKP